MGRKTYLKYLSELEKSGGLGYAGKILRGSTVVFLFAVIAAALGYVTRIYLARSLSPEEFGLFFAVNAFVGFFWAFKDVGFKSAIARFVPEWIAEKNIFAVRSSVWFGIAFQFAIGAVIFSFLFLGSEFLSLYFFRTVEAKAIIQILSLEILLAVFFMNHIIQGFQKMAVFGSIDVVRNGLSLLFIFFLIHLGAFGVSLGFFLASMVVQVVFLYYIFSRLLKSFSPLLHFGKEQRDAFSFGIVLFTGSVSAFILSYMDTIILTAFRGVGDVALYQAALPTAQILWIFATSFSFVIVPVFSEMWAKNEKKGISTGLAILHKFLFVFLIAPVLVIIVWPELIMGILFGEIYAGSADALKILALGSLFYSLLLLNYSTLTAIKKPATVTKVVVVSSVISLVLNLAFVPSLGIIGSAVSMLLTYLVSFFITTFYLKKMLGIVFPFSSVGRSLAAGLLALAAMELTKISLVADVFTELVATLVVAFAAYIAFVRFFRAIGRDDIKILKGMGVRIPKFLEKIFR